MLKFSSDLEVVAEFFYIMSPSMSFQLEHFLNFDVLCLLMWLKIK